MTKLETIRRQKGLTQEDLSKKAGISRATIVALEKEDHLMSVGTSKKLAKALKVEIKDIL